MLKNKFKLIAILAIIVLLFTVPIARADNETQENNSTDTTTTDVQAINERSNNY